MYLSILKRDLKRKKTMNIILLLFIILASTFISSSANNMLTVTTALDSYFEKAGVPDYLAATRDISIAAPITDTLDGIKEVDSYEIEPLIYLNTDNMIFKGEKLNTRTTSLLQPFEKIKINLFDEDNQAVNDLKQGKILITRKMMSKNNISVGDKITFKLGNASKTLEVAGSVKDAVLGSDMMGMARFIVSQSDYDELIADTEYSSLYSGSLCNIYTDDTAAIKAKLSEQDSGMIFDCDQSTLKMAYVMDLVIAGVLLVMSVCLILIAFLVLRFTIYFSMTEEYREIGVMKAIGIKNVKIRGLYMLKYLALAIIGSIAGFFISIPFGKMMLQSVSKSIVMGTDDNYLINIICSVLVVAIISLFCFMCTGKMKRFSPVDAIRNGSTGERFKKKGLLKLSKSKFKPPLFMAVNDVIGSPGRFVTINLTFTLCLSMVLILVNTTNTLKSNEIISAFGITERDVYMSDDSKQMSYMVENGRDKLEKDLEEIEQTLEENGMPANCSYEVMFHMTLTHGDKISKAPVYLGIGTTADQYTYCEGTAPENENEIAMTKQIADALDAKIGDTVTIREREGEKEYIITALFQSMMNMGEAVRLHESVDLDFIQSSGSLAYQIDFTDNPDDAEIKNRIEKIKTLYDTDTVYNAGDFINSLVGVSGMIDSVKMLVLMVVLIITALVTVLMERSFITKERGEIALLKAIGFRNNSIIKWHTLRFVIVAAICAIISLLLMLPLTNLAVGPIFSMMGAFNGIEYAIVPLEVYVIYPLLIIGVTLISAFFTAQYVRIIPASESSETE